MRQPVMLILRSKVTPQTLPGRGGLDARLGLPYVVLRGTRLARLNGNSAEDSQMPSKPFLAFEFQTDADAFS